MSSTELFLAMPIELAEKIFTYLGSRPTSDGVHTFYEAMKTCKQVKVDLSATAPAEAAKEESPDPSKTETATQG